MKKNKKKPQKRYYKIFLKEKGKIVLLEYVKDEFWTSRADAECDILSAQDDLPISELMILPVESPNSKKPLSTKQSFYPF